MFEPNASWSLPSHLFLVSEWSAYCTAGRTTRRAASTPCRRNRPSGRRTPPPSTAAQAGPKNGGGNPKHAREEQGGERPAHLRLDRPDLPAAQVARQLGVLRGERDRARLRERRRRDLSRRSSRTSNTPGIWNPLPWFDTVKADHQLGNIQDVDQFYAAAKQRHPAGGLVGGAVGRGERASPRPGELRAELRDQPRQRGDEEPGLGLDGHLPGLGRLGRLLRPRGPARPSTRTATGSGCRASSSAPTPSTGTSTTRR